MSFFGLDTSGHNQSAPGFSQARDPFAGLSNRHDGGESIDFEDTYDGLGDQLQEHGDELNDDTFGEETIPSGGAVGKDFDFFGRTAQVAGAIDEEHMMYTRNNPNTKAASSAYSRKAPAYGYAPPTAVYDYGQSAARPARTGYEKYEVQDDLQVDAALWGTAPKKQSTPAQAAPSLALPAGPAGRKVMSLEEVEAAMKAEAQAKKQAQVEASAGAAAQAAQQQQQMQQPAPGVFDPADLCARPSCVEKRAVSALDQQPSNSGPQYHRHGQPIQILQRPQLNAHPAHQSILRAQSPMVNQQIPIQPTQILQNSDRNSGDTTHAGNTFPPSRPGQQSQASVGRHMGVTHPSHLAHMSETDKAVYLEQEARRAKRNHKIQQLSRDNGFMTPHDKNFIIRIQLQNLVQATGNPAEHADEALGEDFYYQVSTHIRGGQRQNPAQPLNNFAQTYLHQTGNRPGGNRRHRGPENHTQRMEQQVQRAVEAAKNNPKNSQLVIEGSLGKISFSNAKTPKPLLSIKRAESSGEAKRQSTHPKSPAVGNEYNQKAVLRDVEKVYDTLMKLEDHERKMPPPFSDDGDGELIQLHAEWRDAQQKLNERLWRELKIHELVPAGLAIHPFIAMLEIAKGQKALARIFRHVNLEQRTTILTIIIVNLDKFDVVRRGSVTIGHINLDAKLRDDIELFSIAVSQVLFTFLGELGLPLITGILGLFCSEVNVDLVARTRVGVSFLTMILSRAELLVQSGGGRDTIRTRDGGLWEQNYSIFFNIVEPTLPFIFPGTPASAEDGYVWQFLAALGIGANAEQQQRLVLVVKDRVLSTVEVAKTLPQDLARQRLANVNLFMQAIGLDVSLLD